MSQTSWARRAVNYPVEYPKYSLSTVLGDSRSPKGAAAVVWMEGHVKVDGKSRWHRDFFDRGNFYGKIFRSPEGRPCLQGCSASIRIQGNTLYASFDRAPISHEVALDMPIGIVDSNQEVLFAPELVSQPFFVRDELNIDDWISNPTIRGSEHTVIHFIQLEH